MSTPHPPARQRRDALPDTGAGIAKRSDGLLRILVIDGDDAAARRAQSVLEAAGFEVATADLPDIGIVRRVTPDAIVLGLVFRGQASGLDFLERHMADPIAGATPINVHVTKQPLELEHARRRQPVRRRRTRCSRRWRRACGDGRPPTRLRLAGSASEPPSGCVRTS